MKRFVYHYLKLQSVYINYRKDIEIKECQAYVHVDASPQPQQDGQDGQDEADIYEIVWLHNKVYTCVYLNVTQPIDFKAAMDLFEHQIIFPF